MLADFLFLLSINIDSTSLLLIFLYVGFIITLIYLLIFTRNYYLSGKRILVSIMVGVLIIGIGYLSVSNLLSKELISEVRENVSFELIEEKYKLDIGSLISKKDGKGIYNAFYNSKEGMLISKSDYIKPKSNIGIDAYIININKDNISKPIFNFTTSEGKEILSSLNNKVLIIEK